MITHLTQNQKFKPTPAKNIHEPAIRNWKIHKTNKKPEWEFLNLFKKLSVRQTGINQLRTPLSQESLTIENKAGEKIINLFEKNGVENNC